MRTIKHKCFNIYRSIKNLIVWFPIIWNDRDWDYTFLMIIIEKKLKRMSDLHYKYGIAENSNSVAIDLLTASKLVGKVAEEDYTDEAYEQKKHLLDKNKFRFLENGEVEFYGLSESEWEELIKLNNLEHEMLERDIHILFNLMSENLLKWWD